MSDQQRQRHPGGRPTDFRPEYGDKILALMEEGLSLAAAAAEINVHRQRVYEWESRHPEFADAVRLARVKRQLFLERRLLGADSGPVVTSSIFALKNAAPEDWRDRQEVEHSGPDKGPINVLGLNNLSPDEREILRALLARRVGESSDSAEGA